MRNNSFRRTRYQQNQATVMKCKTMMNSYESWRRCTHNKRRNQRTATS